jgi:cyclase
MTLPRLIPVLLHRGGRLVLSRHFSFHQDIGNAQTIPDRYKTWDLDELIYLDITPHWEPSDRREIFGRFVDTIRGISRNCFIPLSAGGGIETAADMHRLIAAGADRIVLSSAAFDMPTLITEGAHHLGAQAIIVCIDARRMNDGTYRVFTRGGKHDTGLSLERAIRQSIDAGAGELMIQSIDRDGTAQGFDMDLIQHAMNATTVPIIACGGAGTADDFRAPLSAGALGVAAANLFTFTEISYYRIKSALRDHGVPMRPAGLGMDYAKARRDRENGSRLGAETTPLWQLLDRVGLME